MPADRDQTKRRQFIVLSGLAIFVIIACVAGFIVINPGGARGGKAVRPGDEDAATRGRGGAGESEEEETGARSASDGPKIKSSGSGHATPEADPGRSKPGAGREGANSADDAPANIDPEEINGPVKGYLIIRVSDRADDRPVIGANVYFPMKETELENEGGEIKIRPQMAEMVKRTNKFGIAVWKESERIQNSRFVVNGGSEEWPKVVLIEQASVAVTAPGYADLFESVPVPKLDPKGTEIALKMSTAVRVSGKARLKRGGAVANVKIEVKQTSRQAASGAAPANGFSITTDALGEFQLKVANDYLYQFVVQATGYAPYTSQVFDFKRDERQVSLVLEKAFGIEGIVTDKSGKGIAAANISSMTENLSTETDADGKFVFDLVKDRIYSNDVVLRITAKGFAPLVKSVLANDRNLRIELAKEGTLKGVVVNEKDKPVAPAQVTCRYFEQQGEVSKQTVDVDAEGNFSFAGFGEGLARVIAHTPDGLASNPVDVPTKPESEAGPVKLRLTMAAAVTGRVTVIAGGPLAGVNISVDGKVSASTDEEGNFSLPGLDPGPHKIRIVNQFPINDPELNQLPLFTTDGKAFYYLPQEKKLNLALGKSETVNFEVTPFEAKYDRKITIRVITVPAETATGVKVTVNPLFGTPPQGIEMPKPYSFDIDVPDGRFETQGQLLNGVSYEIQFVHARYFTATLSRQTLDRVKDGETVEVKLERAFMIKGYVKDGEGNGLEGVGVGKDKNNKWNMTVVTDIHGYFEFGQLTAGEYVISAFKTSYYIEQKTVKIENKDPDPLQIQLVGANEIRIIVLNAGQPQPGAGVHIYRNEHDSGNPDDWKQHFNIGTTDAQGVKFINFHWVRNYQVVALWNDKIGYVNFDNLREQPSREFTLDLEQAYSLKGTVVDSITQAPVPDSFVRAHIEPTGIAGKDGNLFQTQTDQAGNFSLAVPAGMYHFYVPQSPIYKRLDTTGNPVPQGTHGVVLGVDLRDDIKGNYAQVIAFSAPSTMTAGQDYEITVTMKNAGSTTWTSAGNQPWRLGSQGPQDNNTWGMTRVAIKDGTEVRPGESYTFTFTVKAPAAGQYNMQWRMVQDGVQWFGQFTPVRPITVAAAGGG